MIALREDVRRRCADRDDRGRAAPAHIVAPLLAGALLAAGGGVAALVIGLPVAAVAGVVVALLVLAGLALRRILASLVAGAGLRIARPYCPGERVRVDVPCLGGVVDAEIVRVGAAHTTLMTADGLVAVSNRQMLRR